MSNSTMDLINLDIPTSERGGDIDLQILQLESKWIEPLNITTLAIYGFYK